MTAATESLVDLLRQWERDGRAVRALYGRAEGIANCAIQGTVQLLAAQRLVVRSGDGWFCVSLAGARLEHRPVQYVPPPMTKLESVDGVHIYTKSNDWVFITDGGELAMEPGGMIGPPALDGSVG